MSSILTNYLMDKIKTETDFNTQNKLWKSGFEAALISLKNEMSINAIAFMPAEIHQKMIIEREKEFQRWSIKKRIQWEVCRFENSENIIILSTNNEYIAIQQMEKMREEYSYRAMALLEKSMKTL